MTIKLDELSFDGFVEFVFDHLVTQPAWYESDEWKHSFGDGAVTLRHLIRLFREPEFLFRSYSLEQLEQGFWFIPELLCFVRFRGLLWSKRIELALRAECVASMSDLFARFFFVNSLEQSCFMWWDRLAYGYYMEDGRPDDEDGAKIQQAMFEALCRILELDSKACQASALHGLGHLKHPDTTATINAFLSTHPDIDEELKEYALACLTGKVM